MPVVEFEAPERDLDERAEIVAAVFAAKARRWRRRMARRLSSSGPDWADAVPSAEEWTELVEGLRQHLLVSGRVGRDAAIAELRRAGFDVDDFMVGASDLAIAAAVAAIMVTVEGTGRRVSEDVAAAVAQAQAAGETPNDVIRRLGFRGLRPGPLSNELARDWGSTVARGALYAGIDSVLSRLDGTKRWRCVFVNSRKSHIEAHDQEVSLGDPFLIGGYPGRFPHDPQLPVQEVVNCRCGVEYRVEAVSAAVPIAASGAAATFAADAEQRSRGIMVSVEPTVEERRAIRAAVDDPGAVDPEELHVTLAYFGSVDDVPGDEVDRRRDGIRQAMSYVAGACGPVSGEITGLATLGDDEPPAQVGLVDAVGLGSLRATLVDQIAEFCPMGWMRRDHDFLAHVTVAYSDTGAPRAIVGMPVSFDRLYLHWGDDVEEVELRGDGDGEPIRDPRDEAGAPVDSSTVPYDIVKDAGGCSGWAVVKAGSGEVMGCHPTKARARRQQRALYASEEMTVTDVLDPIMALVSDDVADEVAAEIRETLIAYGVDIVEDDAGEDVPGDAEVPTEMEWQGPLTVEGRLSGDRRVIAPGALSWRDFPLPVMLQTKNKPAHQDSEFCGNIWRIERMADGSVWGFGTYDESEAGREARRLVDSGKMRGVSVDMDKAAGVVASLGELGIDGDGEDPETPVEVYTSARIMGVTITPFPAFQEAYIEPYDTAGIKVEIEITEEPEMPETDDDEEPMAASGGMALALRASMDASWVSASASPDEIALVASAGAPRGPAPRAWFDEQPMERPEYLSIGADGRVWGLVCDWETAHIGLPTRRYAPRNPDFTVFYGKRTYTTAEGDRIPVGPIVMDTVHPDLRLRASDAQAFYAHTGSIVMSVRLYANRWGIAAAGTLLSHVSDDQIERLNLADFSPDWREVGRRGLTVCAVLAVPLSGFPSGALAASGGVVGRESLRPRAAFEHGRVTAMVAVGAVVRERPRSVEDRLAALEAERRRPLVTEALAAMGLETTEEARRKRVAAALAILHPSA